jgi:biopolymer transport protein ExbD
MGKVKIKKNDVWIDMTPMSDVMVLLLTFFMLTSTFVKNEPVKVKAPESVSQIQIPEKDVLNIFVDKNAKVFMSIDNTKQLGETLEQMVSTGGYSSLSPLEVAKFKECAMFGVPMSQMKKFLAMSTEEQAKLMQATGIPTDSIDGGMSEFQQWVDAARTANEEIKIALKADAATPYKTVKKVMNELQDMDESHYYMITNLKTSEDQ